MPWEIIQLNNVEKKDRVLETIKKLGFDEESMQPYQNINWLLDEKTFDSSLFYCSYQDDQSIAGHCVLRKHVRPVNLMVGEFTMYTHSMVRYELWSTPIIKSDCDTKIAEILADFLSCIDKVLLAGEVLSIEGLPIASRFYQCVSMAGDQRLLLQLGRAYDHQSICFPETFEAYLQQMSKRSRTSVQYSQRKLSREFRVELFDCNSGRKVGTFLEDAITISKKTYQWNLLGLGLRNREELNDSLLRMSRRGELLSFILRCDDKPIAFMLGYIFQSCYYYIDVGYDPKWASYSPGSVLQLAVIEHLYGLESPPKTFDFSTGYGEHKGRFGNAQQREVNMLILPATQRNRIFVTLYRLVDLTSTTIVSALDRLGIKGQLKKLIRQLS